MPSNERSGESSKPEPTPYYQAARFAGERPAGRAYNQAQQAIFRVPVCDLSTFRFHISRVWHAAVLGDQPPEHLEQRLQKILSAGEPTTLPEELLRQLQRRRADATRLGPWVERHYRPRKHL